MDEFRSLRTRLCLFAALLAFSCAAAAASLGAQDADKKAGHAPVQASLPTASAAAAASGQSSEYVGSATCGTCHDEIYKHWENSPHWKTTLDTKGGPSHQGCEGCHGPGKAHVDGGGDVTKIFIFKDHSAKEINDRCLGCHAGGPQHMNAINSLHGQNEVSCTSCHSPHHAETKDFLLSKPQPQLCYGCHLQQKSQFEMPFHHRVNEGLVNCSDCHNVHGSTKPKQVRVSNTQDTVCFQCHTEKQGPFVFEHPAVKIEGCESCHVPHGGANAHMLKVSNVNLLCIQCHTNSSFSGATNTPSFHNQRTYFQACTLCHSQIHGSNFDPTFFK
jgi:DmsE family decaheme c-type cytochrome